jgi:hypothetical protein
MGAFEDRQARMNYARSVRMQKLHERKSQPAAAVEEQIEDLPDPTEAMALNEHTWLGAPQKSLFIPSWYKPHAKNVQVTLDGEKLGFRVSDVLAHRRWAILPSGALMDPRDFQPLYERYLSEISAAGVDPKLQHIPQVQDYVNVAPDPRGGSGYVAIGFDPNVEAPVADDGQRYDPIRDVIFSIKTDLERSARLERVEALSQMLMRKEINGETFEREMRSMSPQVEIHTETPQPLA